MDYWTRLRLKLIKFFKRNGKKIVIILSIWAVVIMIEYYLRKHDTPILKPISTTYEPYVSVLDKDKEIPEEYREKISNIIDEYFNYCNNGEYENAYNLITEECRKKNYPTLEEFKAYVNAVFEGKKKIYNIQSYSIIDNMYVFNIRILDDILANGSSDGYYYYEEKFILIEENGEIKLSIAEYIGDENPEITVEDDNMKVEITNKSMDYETETYTLQITNKTDNYIVISDNTLAQEISLYVDGDQRAPLNMNIAFLSIPPRGQKTQEIQFNKYYDEGVADDKIVFNKVRVLKEYDWTQGTTQENIDNALDIYTFEMSLN